MAYCTATQARYLQPKLTTTELADAAMTNILSTFVEPLINHELSGEFDVPFTTAPPIITAVAAMMLLAYALDGKWGRSGAGTKSSEATDLRDEAYKILDSLSDPLKGKRLLDASGDEVARLYGSVLSTEVGADRHSDAIFVGDETNWTIPSESRED